MKNERIVKFRMPIGYLQTLLNENDNPYMTVAIQSNENHHLYNPRFIKDFTREFEILMLLDGETEYISFNPASQVNVTLTIE